MLLLNIANAALGRQLPVAPTSYYCIVVIFILALWLVSAILHGVSVPHF